jgi:hypothetical protein
VNLKDQAKTTSVSADSAETERVKDANGEETGPAATAAGGTSKVKGAKEADEPKKGYVHVRARSGQATNRHSVAEKVPTLLRSKHIS